VHPSWRDLVVDALAHDAGERRRFLASCGVAGAALALSTAGGAGGERRRPLLREDADWDALADGLHRLCGEIDEADAVRLLNVLAETEPGPESSALAALVARRLGRRWHRRVVSVDALAAWSAVASRLLEPVEPPSPVPAWLELEPDRAPADPAALERFADWLRLAELLDRHDPELLAGLGFPDRHADVLAEFARAVPEDEPPLEHDLRVQALDRLIRLASDCAPSVYVTLTTLREDLALPEWEPLPEPVAPVSPFPVARVLRDLVD
jgi:hypothetical protein